MRGSILLRVPASRTPKTTGVCVCVCVCRRGSEKTSYKYRS